MGDISASHAGIELDIIRIPGLPFEAGSPQADETPAHPDDYRVFVTAIFRKMKSHDSFLSFSSQISNVNKILTMAYSSADDIARVILRDMSLTTKVLKLVNSSLYRHFSPKGISTISEAMIILGTDEVRLAAASMKIFEMMQDLSHSALLRDLTLKSLQRSMMARQMGKTSGFSEIDHIQVAAMIYDLGEYLVALYAPDKYITIAVAAEKNNLSLSEASRSVLGITYSDLGRIVGMKLHLPENILTTMRPIAACDSPRTELSLADTARHICTFAKEICDIPADAPPQIRASRIQEISRRYDASLGMDPARAQALLQDSREKINAHAAALKITLPTPPGPLAVPKEPADTYTLQKVLETLQINLKNRVSIHTILSSMVHQMYQTHLFSNICVAIRKKETQTMNARFSAGEARAKFQESFVFRLNDTSDDLFNQALRKNRLVVVTDLKCDTLPGAVPDWYTKRKFPRSFALRPIYVSGKIISLCYISWPCNSPEPGPDTVSHLEALSRLMIQAFTLHKA